MSISYSTQPSEYTSERASTFSPLACSGDKYWAVPITAEVLVSLLPLSASARAMPKSITFTAPALLIMMFAGLTSRWMMPCWWLKFNASHASAMTSTACCWFIGPSLRTMSRNVTPSTYSITM